MKPLLLIILCITTPLLADEISNLETLIVVTQRQLEKQQQALALFKQFQQARSAFVEEPDNARRGAHLVKIAMQLHEVIDTAHLTHLFSSDALEEIAFFTNVGYSHHIQ